MLPKRLCPAGGWDAGVELTPGAGLAGLLAPKLKPLKLEAPDGAAPNTDLFCSPDVAAVLPNPPLPFELIAPKSGFCGCAPEVAVFPKLNPLPPLPPAEVAGPLPNKLAPPPPVPLPPNKLAPPPDPDAAGVDPNSPPAPDGAGVEPDAAPELPGAFCPNSD